MEIKNGKGKREFVPIELSQLKALLKKIFVKDAELLRRLSA